MGSGGRSVDDTHHVVNVDGNLMVMKTYAPLASASSADELLLLASENSSSHNSSLRRCKTSVDVSLASLDPTPDAPPVAEDRASEASPRLTARALRRHDVACARALRPEQNPFKLHSDGAFDPFRRAEPPPRKKPPNCAFLWFLRNNG